MVYAGQRSVTQYQSIPRALQLISASTPTDDPKRRQSGGVIDFDRDFSGLSARWIGRYDLGGGRLTGGLRHSNATYQVTDHYVTEGDQNDSGTVRYSNTAPLLAALYRLTPTLNVYASAARGFETPTLNELFYSGPGGGFSYDLKAATSNHFEGGLKAFVGNDSSLDLAFFDIRTANDLAVKSSFGGRTSYQNVAQTTRQGVEVAVDSRWAGDFTTRIAYSGLVARYAEPFTTLGLGVPTLIVAGRYLPGIPGHTLFGELVWCQQAGGWHAGIEGMAAAKSMSRTATPSRRRRPTPSPICASASTSSAGRCVTPLSCVSTTSSTAIMPGRWSSATPTGATTNRRRAVTGWPGSASATPTERSRGQSWSGTKR